MARPVELLERHRYALFGAALLALLAVHTANGHRLHDFWEHAAVVREQVRAPLAPLHPQVDSDAPHPYFSPYTLAVALGGRLLSLDARAALSAAGLANAALLLAGLALAGRRLTGTVRAAPYALFLTLLLWGDSAWGYSGFFHLANLGYVLAYPSTFASALALVALAVALDYLGAGGRARPAAVALGVAVVLLTHPLTAPLLLAGCVAGALLADAPRRRRVILLASAAGGCVLACLWPFWPVLDLALGESAAFDASNRELYGARLASVLPALLLGAAAFAFRLRRARRDVLAGTTALLVLGYGAGYLLERYAFGRLLPSAVLGLHLAVAGELARIEERVGRPTRRVLLSAAVALVLAAFAFGPHVRPFLRHVRNEPFDGRVELAFLEEHVGARDVLLADLPTAWLAQGFAGVAVAVTSPLAWVDDRDARRRDVNRFFAEATSPTDRRAILERYGVAYVLTDAKGPAVGELVFEDARYRLYAVR